MVAPHPGGMDLTRIIKSVSLDESSAKISDILPNFSHFVRECLYRHAVKQASECTQPKPDRFQGRCNPLSKVPCFVCWPNGKPPVEAVKQWSQDKLAMSFLDLKAKEHNQHLIDLANMNTVQKSAKLPSEGGVKGHKSWLKRLLRR